FQNPCLMKPPRQVGKAARHRERAYPTCVIVTAAPVKAFRGTFRAACVSPLYQPTPTLTCGARRAAIQIALAFVEGGAGGRRWKSAPVSGKMGGRVGPFPRQVASRQDNVELPMRTRIGTIAGILGLTALLFFLGGDHAPLPAQLGERPGNSLDN